MDRRWIVLKLAFVLTSGQIDVFLVKASDAPYFPIVENYASKSVFITFFELLQKYKPLNFGSGFPDFPPPAILTNALAKAAKSQDFELSQYSPNDGHYRLRNAVASFYSKHLNRTLNPNENVVITVGAAEALFDIFQAFTRPGDEWIVIEPYFDPYVNFIKAARGIAKFIALKPTTDAGKVSASDWTFDRNELVNLFNKRTIGIIVNTPNNPIGKMFNLEELTFISDLVKKQNALVIFDEVYEFLTYDNNEHIRISTIPGMFERTISVSSAGKIFSATGYRIGWAYGSKTLVDNIKSVHATTVRAASTPIQEAVAVALEEEIKNVENPCSYLKMFRRKAEEKLQYLAKVLRNAGMTPIMPEGGYFLVANVTQLRERARDFDGIGGIFTYVEWLVREIGIAGMPLEGFYNEKNRSVAKGGIRFTIIKKDESLKAGEKLLDKWISENSSYSAKGVER